MESEAFVDTRNLEQEQSVIDLLCQRLASDSLAMHSPASHRDVLAYCTAIPNNDPTTYSAEAMIAVKRVALLLVLGHG